MSHTRFVPAFLVLALAAAVPAHADGLTFLPALKDGFKAAPSLAAVGGVMNASAARDDAIGVYGLDFNMNCGLIQTPENRIRTHVQLLRANQSGIQSTSVELSPRYTLPLGGGFSVGAGPLLAWVKADTGAGDKDLFGYGAVGGVAYRSGHYYSGIDARYLNTETRDRVQLDNWTFTLKVGVNF